jgi:hypothetical protein
MRARKRAGSKTSILFMADRIKFCRPDGTEQPANSGAPPVLVAFGTRAAARLNDSGIQGAGYGLALGLARCRDRQASSRSLAHGDV